MDTVRERAVNVMHLIGRRGAALIWFGSLDFIVGLTLSDEKFQPQGEVARTAYIVVLEVASYKVWATAWALVGVACIVQAFARNDRFAFACAIGIKLVWGFCFLASWILYGAYRGFLSCAVWFSFAAFVAIIAGWPEPFRLDESTVEPDEIIHLLARRNEAE